MEPTETESRENLEQYIDTVPDLLAGESWRCADISGRTGYTPRRRPDETAAARRPILRWKPAPFSGEAAE